MDYSVPQACMAWALNLSPMKGMVKYLILLCASMSVGLTGCIEKRNLDDNVVIFQLTAQPESMHPINYQSAMARYLFDYTQRSLVRSEMRDGRIVPHLLAGDPERDETGLAYQYTLSGKAKWDDGTPVTAEDVLFSLKVSKCPLTDNASRRSLFFNLKNVVPSATDPMKFRVEMKAPYYLNDIFFDEIYLIQKAHWDPNGVLDKFTLAQFDSENFNASKYPALGKFFEAFNDGSNGRDPEKLVGLGPYQLTEWNTGVSMTFTRKENWWGAADTFVYDRAFPERIIVKFIKDDAAIALALKKEAIDVTTTISTSQLIKLQKKDYFNKNYTSGYVDQFAYNYFGMNEKPEPGRPPVFTDQRTRRAMAHIVNVDEIIQVIALGKAARLASPAYPFTEEANKALQPIPYDIEKAKQLLSEAGWVDTDGDNIRDKMINGIKVPFKFQLSYMSSPTTKEIVLMVKDDMYKAGVDMVPNPMDFAIFYKNAQNHNFDAMFGSWSGNRIPDAPEQLWHTKNWANKGYNFCGFGDSKSDKLIEDYQGEVDAAKRKVLGDELQRMIYEDQPYVFLYTVKRKIAMHNRFTNPGMYADKPGVMLNAMQLIMPDGNSGSAVISPVAR